MIQILRVARWTFGPSGAGRLGRRGLLLRRLLLRRRVEPRFNFVNHAQVAKELRPARVNAVNSLIGRAINMNRVEVRGVVGVG